MKRLLLTLLTLLNRHFNGAFGFREEGLGFLAGLVGLADLGDDLLGGLLGNLGDGELEEVALGDGRVEAPLVCRSISSADLRRWSRVPARQ